MHVVLVAQLLRACRCAKASTRALWYLQRPSASSSAPKRTASQLMLTEPTVLNLLQNFLSNFFVKKNPFGICGSGQGAVEEKKRKSNMRRREGDCLDVESDLAAWLRLHRMGGRGGRTP